MKCERAKELFTDEWAGTLGADFRAQFERHLADCPSCRNERNSLCGLWNRLEQLPPESPDRDLRPRFYAMLEGYQQGLEQHRSRRSSSPFFGGWAVAWNLRQPALQVGILAMLILGISFAGGYLLRSTRNGSTEIATLRDEVHEMRRMVSLSLLKQQSATDRLKGVSWSSQIHHPDREFLTTLMNTLDRDPNVDVRLAAVDALSRFVGDPGVRSGLVQSLRRQDSPLVQISLIDLLVQLNERQSIEILKQLTSDSHQNEAVRQRAQWGLQVLS